MNIYVGNISHSSTEEGLKQVFEQYGTVASVKIIKDKFTGSSRGFAFVEMPEEAEAKQAIAGLNGVEVDGRPLRVNEARPAEAHDNNRERRGGPRTGGSSRPGGFSRSNRGRF